MAGDEGRLESDCGSVEDIVDVETGQIWESTGIETRNWLAKCITQGIIEDVLTIFEILLAPGSKRNVHKGGHLAAACCFDYIVEKFGNIYDNVAYTHTRCPREHNPRRVVCWKAELLSRSAPLPLRPQPS
jgi:hypothetical protein